MASYHYERLSAMDYSFLASETPTTPMHVSGLEIFEAGPLRTKHGGVKIERIRAAYQGALHHVPRYRQKLMWIPVEDRPVWVDDPHFRLDNHIRHVSLPRPGGKAELERMASQLVATHLDRSRPLWEAWVIEGLEGDRFAILAKTHHCMIDGLAGVEIVQLMLSPSPRARAKKPKPWTPRPAPAPTELIRDEALRFASMPLQALRSIGETPELASELSRNFEAMQEFVEASMSASSETPINGPLGPLRRFDWLTMSLADVKAIRKALDCTVNDVFLAIATEAFRGLLDDDGIPLEEVIFRASSPVSLRAEGDHDTAGNRVATWFVTLPVDEPDRIAQLEKIRAETERLKASNQAKGMGIVMDATELLPAPLMNMAAGFASNAINTIVSNVPGPQIPLYFLGAPLEGVVAGVPLIENIGLGIALMTYNGRVFWGLTADYDLVPDLGGFGERLAASMAELAEAAGVTLSDDDTGPSPTGESHS